MAHPLADLDPDGPALVGSGLYGLPIGPEDAALVVIPVPWEVTTSYGKGTAEAPQRVLEASHQVELFRRTHPDTWRAGISMRPADPRIAGLDARVGPIAQRLAAGEVDPEAHAEVEAACKGVDTLVRQAVALEFDAGRIPAVLGGDHSVSLGAIQEASARFPDLGILHVDAHADLRVAYQGFSRSHASILHNVLDSTRVRTVVQVGIRDLGQAESRRIDQDPRLTAFDWSVLSEALAEGTPWRSLLQQMVSPLPPDVWITFDIDGLDPALCPGTGTPVPGGLNWDQAVSLIDEVERSGRRIVGFDLVEVGASEWDANVGARLLYQLAIAAIASRESGSSDS